MTREEVLDYIGGEAIFYGEENELDSAIIGVASRCGMPDVTCYDYDKLIDALKETFDITEADLTAEEIEDGVTVEDKKYETAVEWYEFNIIGGYVGEFTPIIISTNI